MINIQRVWGQWAVITRIPKVLFLFVFLTTFGTLENFDWLIGWFIMLSVQMFKTLIVMYRKGNFVYHQWGCTLILFAIVLSLYIPVILPHP